MLEDCLDKLMTNVQMIFNKTKLAASVKLAATQQRLYIKARSLQAEAQVQLAKLQKKIKAAAMQAGEIIGIAIAVLMIKTQTLKHHLTVMFRGMRAQLVQSFAELKERVQSKYNSIRRTWCGNQHFTFWLIPADGHTIAKKHVKKSHIKYAFTSVFVLLISVSATIGVLAHYAIQSEAQRQELAEYKATKQAQEQKIQELQQMAEDNQKELAYLSSLEEKVRKEMVKSGVTLPPKTDTSAYAGKGGPTVGDVSPVGIIMEQEKNLQMQTQAKKTDFENLLTAIKDENYRRDMTPSQWPTEGGLITSYFGGRANPFDGYSRDWHPGIDIANNYGAPIYASASGYVEQAGWYGGYGRYILINHDYGYQTAYGHLSSISVSSGQYVSKGQVIGYVGSSGYSTGPHLHFEVIRYGEQVNPLRLI